MPIQEYFDCSGLTAAVLNLFGSMDWWGRWMAGVGAQVSFAHDLVPNKPRTSTSLWPRLWGPLPYSVAWYQLLWSLQLVLPSQDCWGSSRSWFHINFWSICSITVKYAVGILLGIVLNLQIALGSMDILMMLILPIYEHGLCFIYLYLPQFLSSVSHSFPSTGPIPCWLHLFLGTYFCRCCNNKWDCFLSFSFW